MHNKTAVITGASAGIGWAYAMELARANYSDLVLVARREDRLIQLKNDILLQHPKLKVHVEKRDLTSSFEREELFNSLRDKELHVTLLVNNAGFGSVGAFELADISRELKMIELNCRAPIHLCHMFIPEMIKEKEGAIINVCSTAAFQAMPYMATYGATKAFLLNWSVALATELNTYGVKVLANCPGPTESEFHLVAELEDKMSFLPAMTAEIVAEQTLVALSNNKKIKINGAINFVLTQLNRILPRATAASLVERILRAHSRRI